MTPDNERSDDEPIEKADTQSTDISATEIAGSRFDKFLNRLDEQEGKRDHSEAETDSEPTLPDEERTESESESEADLADWIWGPSKRPRDVDHTFEPSGSQPDHGDEEVSVSGSKSDNSRLWNTVLDNERSESSPEPEPSQESPDAPEDRRVPEPDAPSTGTDEQEDIGERGDRSPSTEHRDRWAELGASLGEGKSERSDAGTEEQPDSGTAEYSWETADTQAAASEGRSGGPSVLSGNRSEKLDQVTDAESVLVLGPTNHPVSDAICSRFLVGEDGPRDVLFVTFEDSASDRIDVVRNVDDWSGGEIGIVKVGPTSRNAAATSETTSGPGGGSITVRRVSNPGDLSKLGIVITQLLSKFNTTSRRTVLCFHTLSSLHNQIGTKTLFRFLNTLQGRLASEDAVGHYHMDPELHDEIVIETLRPIFDSVIRYSAEGELEVE